MTAPFRREIFAEHPAAMFLVHPSEGRIVGANAAAAALYGWTVDELCRMRVSELNTLPPERLRAELASAEQRRAAVFHFEHRVADGSTRMVEVLSGPVEVDGETLLHSIVIDETARVMAERALDRRTRLYRMLSGTNHALVRHHERDALFRAVCEVAVREGQLRCAWIGLVGDDRRVIPVARAGERVEFVDRLAVVADVRDPHGGGPAGVAITEGRVAHVPHIAAEARMAPWHALTRAENIHSAASFPLRVEGAIIGAMTLYASEPGFFGADELATLEEMAADLSFGLTVLAQREQAAEADERAAAATDRLSTYLEDSPSIAYSVRINADGSWAPEWVSSNAARILGYGEEATLDPAWWASHVHPDDHDDAVAAGGRILREGAYRHEYRFLTASGEVRWILDTARYVPDASGGGRVSGTWVDVTDRRAIQEQLQLRSIALQSAADAVVITDRDGRIEWANPAFTRLTGYTVEDALGRNPRELVRSGRQERSVYDAMWRTILAGEVWRGEVVNRRKDGSHYHEWLTIAPVMGPNGQPTHFVATKRDLTEDRSLRERLVQAQKMESIGRLAGGVAHDFNNLLTVISGSVELALSGSGSPADAREDLEQVRRAAERAAGLTRQLLAFSRRQVFQRKVLDVTHLVGDISRMLQRLVGEEVRVELACAPDTGQVIGDPGQLEQALVTLAMNARDAMPSGGTLTLSTRRVTLGSEVAGRLVGLQAGPYVELSVRDTGVGMDETMREHLFEPFYSTKPQGKGTGLGLSSVYGIVRQSEGAIDVESAPGRGTVFRIYLPASAEASAQAGSASEARFVPSSGGATILVVDDQADILAVTTRMLQRAGYQTLTATSGDEAESLFAEHAPSVDLLLTDVVMPGMSGPALAERLQRQKPGLLVLAMSGYTDDAVVRRGIEALAVPFLPKPFTLEELTRRVAAILDGSEPAEGAPAFRRTPPGFPSMAE